MFLFVVDIINVKKKCSGLAIKKRKEKMKEIQSRIYAILMPNLVYDSKFYFGAECEKREEKEKKSTRKVCG